jgi:hypothetical protein
VIDAAGAIYVIGGQGTEITTFYADVWVSTDGGAVPDSVKGVGEYWVGTRRDTRGTKGVLRGSAGVPRKPRGLISEYSRGYSRLSTVRSCLYSSEN